MLGWRRRARMRNGGAALPADFEDCAAAAEGARARKKTAKLSECNAKFAGRRKPGGGYTYFDFMQNRNFDIAGPNARRRKSRRRSTRPISAI